MQLKIGDKIIVGYKWNIYFAEVVFITKNLYPRVKLFDIKKQEFYKYHEFSETTYIRTTNYIKIKEFPKTH